MLRRFMVYKFVEMELKNHKMFWGQNQRVTQYFSNSLLPFHFFVVNDIDRIDPREVKSNNKRSYWKYVGLKCRLA